MGIAQVEGSIRVAGIIEKRKLNLDVTGGEIEVEADLFGQETLKFLGDKLKKHGGLAVDNGERMVLYVLLHVPMYEAYMLYIYDLLAFDNNRVWSL